jgi:ribosome-binding protein aMBF1 (putative translation factor)
MSVDTPFLSPQTLRKPLGPLPLISKTPRKTEIDLSVRKPYQRLNKAIQSARLAKKMTQKDIAKFVNVKLQVYADWETGKAIPATAAIGKLEHVFGTKLPGPGTPAAEKKLALEKRIAASASGKS